MFESSDKCALIEQLLEETSSPDEENVSEDRESSYRPQMMLGDARISPDSDDKQSIEACAVLHGLNTDKLRAVLRCLDVSEIKEASREAAALARQYPSPIEESLVVPFAFGVPAFMRWLSSSVTRLPDSVGSFEKFIAPGKVCSVYSLEFLVCVCLLSRCLEIDENILKHLIVLCEPVDHCDYLAGVKLGLEKPRDYYQDEALVSLLMWDFRHASKGLAADLAAEQVDPDDGASQRSVSLQGRSIG